MTRPLRIEYPDAVYHITARGNGRQEIFHDELDYRKFLDLLGKTVSRFNWACHAFCLMGNHYHLMIETPDANISKGMHHLNGSFSQAHHKRYDTVGHLFQGRFKAIFAGNVTYGYDQKEIADFLGLHYTTVSLAIKRQEARQEVREEARAQSKSQTQAQTQPNY